MDNIDIIALLLTIIAMFIAVWIFRRVLIIAAILIIIAVIAYLFIQNNPASTQTPAFKTRQGQLLEQFRDNYCGYMYTKEDSLMCELIVEPIYNDITTNYNIDSVRHLNKTQLANLIIKVASQHKNEIISNLKRQDAAFLWNYFVQDIKNKQIF